jgi:hypothetical protein
MKITISMNMMTEDGENGEDEEDGEAEGKVA